MTVVHYGPDPIPPHQAFLRAGASHNVMLRSIPPLTSDSYRDVMVGAARLLGVAP